MYQAIIYYTEDEYEGFGETDSLAIINAIFEFTKSGHDTPDVFRAFVIVKDKVNLSFQDINDLKGLFAIKTYQVQESKDPITEFHGYCSDMVISYYNDILYIYTEDGILERTEKDIDLIEEGEFDYIDIPHGMKFPKWATYYLYNNSTEEFKKVVLEHSEFDIFS